MKRYVDVDKVLETAKEYEKDFARYILERNVCGLVKINEILEDTPTADVVAVIRCKNCKHYVTNTELLGNVCNRLFTVFPMKPNDFCSYGERKDEE